ncbi:hypothetical protein JTB14_030213 [Gonioctena quinquepunctata]|nr:hypothetical protein JTB14_030213 [Gonioctena quinquepunctata]
MEVLTFTKTVAEQLSINLNTYHRFPQCETMCKIWSHAYGKEELLERTRTSEFSKQKCSEHFSKTLRRFIFNDSAKNV